MLLDISLTQKDKIDHCIIRTDFLDTSIYCVNMDFWKRVEDELEFQGKSKKELASLTNIKEQTLHKAFERRSAPSAETALKIAKALNVSIEYLITGKEDKDIPENQRISPQIKELITKLNHFTPKQKQVIFDIAEVIEEK